MKTIVIDARESGTSTGRYIDKLIEHLYPLSTGFKFIILAKPHRMSYFQKLTPKFEVVESAFKEFTFDEQLGLRKQLNALNADLLHFGMVQQPVLYKGLVVTTIHDLTTVRFTNPDKNIFIYKSKQQVYKRVIKNAARKSALVITPTNYVKNDLVQFSGINPEKVVVTYESADPITDSPKPITSLTNKSFIMYIGRPTPHKNLPRLIEAFAELKEKTPDLWLVLAGKKDANYERIAAMVQRLNIKHIFFTDFVSEAELRWLYEHCLAYIFPSLSEGFGLPGLEAMQHKAPVISSNATCLPEVYGDGALYFDPKNNKEITQAILAIYSNKPLRNKLIVAGTKQVQQYSWDKMANETLAVYKKALGE